MMRAGRIMSANLIRISRQCVVIYSVVVAIGIASVAFHNGIGAALITASTVMCAIVLGIALAVSLDVRE